MTVESTGADKPPRPTQHVAESPALHELIEPTACFEPIATGGFEFIEGPLWDAVEGALLFSDIPASVIRRWLPGSGLDGAVEWRRPTNMSNALTYDRDGNVLICEHVPPGVRRLRPDGGEELLARQWQGKDLNSPNDLVARQRCGSIYFTDPPSGRTAGWGVERPQDLDFQGVFRIRPDDGALELIGDGYTIPNGCCLSPDESLLYVNDSHDALIHAYPLAADGSIAGPPRLFADGITSGDIWDGCPDGIKCDEHGNVWVSAPFGLWVYAPTGERIGTLAAPEFITNFTWGGSDGRDLFCCGWQTMFRLRTKVRGSGIPPQR